MQRYDSQHHKGVHAEDEQKTNWPINYTKIICSQLVSQQLKDNLIIPVFHNG